MAKRKFSISDLFFIKLAGPCDQLYYTCKTFTFVKHFSSFYTPLMFVDLFSHYEATLTWSFL